jgi:F-box interacting protein
MVGTCNGLLCFLDVDQGSINVVEPFTGESRALPLPPKTGRRHELDAYSFGFDPNTRRYKIIHQGESLYTAGSQVLLHVYTVGAGKKWRSLHVADVKPGYSYGRPVCVGGAVYWDVIGMDEQWKFARLDLATEEVTMHFIQTSQQISLTESDGWAFLTADTWMGHAECLVCSRGRLLGVQAHWPSREAASLAAADDRVASPTTWAPAAAGLRWPVRSPD